MCCLQVSQKHQNLRGLQTAIYSIGQQKKCAFNSVDWVGMKFVQCDLLFALSVKYNSILNILIFTFYIALK